MCRIGLSTLSILMLFAFTAQAHFGMLIPDRALVTSQKETTVNLQLSFSHPMERNGMTMEKPAAFYVVTDGEKRDLLPELKPVKVFGKEAWSVVFSAFKPALHQFVMEPKPYWEPAEDCYIIHYTKTFVSALGGDEGWDEPVGLKTEIVPLSRPFGNYVGNLFQGRVLLDGKPVPGAEVEVEFYNRDGRYEAPADVFITQVVKADDNGVFSYAVPFEGWWGFAALNTASEKMPHNGAPKDVELGAVLWAQFVNPVRK
ncbi:MAG: DUF4198 domain-containing protein [bacterium]|jgi:cobalt/nickel transport protein|nr:DUF4198 domain-containing protein [bacterium]